MTDSQVANLLSSVFPPPPPFYTHFTPENHARLAAARGEHGDHDANTNAVASSDPVVAPPPVPPVLPTELQCLIPPSPPSGAYRSFGGLYDINAPLPSLRDMGVEQLFPTVPPASLSSRTPTAANAADASHDNSATAIATTSPIVRSLDRSRELTRLVYSLLLNFLELADILAQDPRDAPQKLEDLRTLFLNAHHLVNEYRPHQGLEALITLMEERVKMGREQIEVCKEVVERAEALVGGLKEEVVKIPLAEADEEEQEETADQKHYEDVWAAMDEIWAQR